MPLDQQLASGRLSAHPHIDGAFSAFVPTDRVENHASFLAELPSGGLACAWFAGTAEGEPDVRIFVSSLARDGETWSAAEQISDNPQRSDQNPVLFARPDGAVELIHTSQEFGAQDTSRVLRRISTDLVGWSDAEALVDDLGLFIRQPIVRRSDSRWLLPAFRCRPLPGRQWNGSNDVSVVLITDDAGATWREVEVPGSLGLVHMAIIDRGAAGLVAFFRSRWADAVYRSASADDGESWEAPVPVDVPNNNSSIAVASAGGAGGPLLMVANPVSAPVGAAEGDDVPPSDPRKRTEPGERQPLAKHAVWSQPRIPLTLFRSDDDGVTWRRVLDLETTETLDDDRERTESTNEGPRARHNEISYPTIVVGRDGAAHIAYSYLRKAIRYVRLPQAVWSAE